MSNLDKRNPKNWTQEENDRVVAVFQLLIEMDKKQNPDFYKATKSSDQTLIDNAGREVKL